MNQPAALTVICNLLLYSYKSILRLSDLTHYSKKQCLDAAVILPKNLLVERKSPSWPQAKKHVSFGLLSLIFGTVVKMGQPCGSAGMRSPSSDLEEQIRLVRGCSCMCVFDVFPNRYLSYHCPHEHVCACVCVYAMAQKSVKFLPPSVIQSLTLRTANPRHHGNRFISGASCRLPQKHLSSPLVRYGMLYVFRSDLTDSACTGGSSS